MDSLSRKRMKKMWIALGVVFGGILAFNLIKGLLVGYLFSHYVPPAVSVASVVAEKRHWKPSLSAVGNFAAVNGVDVNTQLGGQVTAIHFNSGQFITKGSPLVDLDDNVDIATLKYNEAELALQKNNYQRQLDLIKRNATATSSVDEARAKLLEAEANVQKSQALVNQKHIIAPFSGMLGIRRVDLGQYLQPGQTGIVTLQSMDPIFLHFFIPEHLISKVNLKQNIRFSIEEAPKMLFHGEITAINSKIDSNTHMVEVQATINNCPTAVLKKPFDNTLANTEKSTDGNLLVACHPTEDADEQNREYLFMPGTFADIHIEQPAIPDVVVVPTTAISFTMYGDSVFVIEKNKDGHKDKNDHDILTVKRVFVTTGAQQGNETVIKKGISAGDWIVATGELKLENDTQVTINNSVKLPHVSNIDELGQ